MPLILNKEKNLIQKYNVPGPRYTSYPTVPYWDNNTFSLPLWKEKVIDVLKNYKEGISLYIHLPFCESLCTFCGCNTRITVNHQVEQPYINAILAEWDLYLKLTECRPVIKEIHLGGGTPTFFSPENLEKLVNGLLEKAELADEIDFAIEGHPNNTTKAHLETLAGLGFKRISFGIQDFDPKVQHVIHRKQSFEKVREVTECARAKGFQSVNYDILYGLPLQTAFSIKDTIDKVNMLKPDRIAFYSYAHVPWIKPGQRKFTELDLPDNDAKQELYVLGKNMLENSGYKEIGMDHFARTDDALYIAATQKKLHRNFMGYTSSQSNSIIGLGVSSISDTGTAYGQNVKSVEEYYSLVEKGIIPVFRGHLMHHEDIILRRHILNLMCRQETSWVNPGDQCFALFEGLVRMKDLEDDGLVKSEAFSLTITDQGKPFIRNICMALDQRMRVGSKGGVQFSKVI